MPVTRQCRCHRYAQHAAVLPQPTAATHQPLPPLTTLPTKYQATQHCQTITNQTCPRPVQHSQDSRLLIAETLLVTLTLPLMMWRTVHRRLSRSPRHSRRPRADETWPVMKRQVARLVRQSSRVEPGAVSTSLAKVRCSLLVALTTNFRAAETLFYSYDKMVHCRRKCVCVE